MNDDLLIDNTKEYNNSSSEKDVTLNNSDSSINIVQSEHNFSTKTETISESVESTTEVQQQREEVMRQLSSEMGGMEKSDENFVVRLRGLPWQITEEDIVGFFSGAVVLPNGVFFRRDSSGRPTGEGYVRLESQKDVDEALKCHKNYIGKRYIEVFSSSMDEWNRATASSSFNRNYSTSFNNTSGNDGYSRFNRRGNRGSYHNHHTHHHHQHVDYYPPLNFSEGYVIRMRGLPFSASIEDVLNFFHGLNVSSSDVFVLTKPSGSVTGDAYVRFHSSREFNDALALHNSRIGRRYIELFKSSNDELSSMLPRYSYLRSSSSSPRTSYNRNYEDKRSFNRHPSTSSYYNQPSHHHHSSPQSSSSYYCHPSNCMVRLRGLPYTVSIRDIEEFFGGIRIIRNGIHLTPELSRSGEAYVEFYNEDDKMIALSRQGQRMESRYIDVYPVSESEYYHVIRGSNIPSSYSSSSRYSNSSSSSMVDPNLVRMLQTSGNSNSGRHNSPSNYYDSIQNRSSDISSYSGYNQPHSNEYTSSNTFSSTSASYSYSPHMQHHNTTQITNTSLGGSVVIRGLAATTTVADIQKYFAGYQILPDSIQVASNVERTVFEATVRFSTVSEASRVLREKESGYIGSSYVKLYER